MPMKKISTSCSTDLDLKRKSSVVLSASDGPELKTLDFLRQFARSYHAEPSLDADLCGWVMN